MTFATLFLAFLAGLACGLALRPRIDRRRRLSSVYRSLRARQRQAAPDTGNAGDGYATPRDYYLADRRERGTLAEGFGLRRDASRATGAAMEETDANGVALPRDYYERETPDDEGLLSEGYGLRRKAPPADAA